jgi:hypothetical protein
VKTSTSATLSATLGSITMTAALTIS